MHTETKKRSQRPNYLRDTGVWWDNRVPVATTGWGALFVIAPLIVAHFLVWVTGGSTTDSNTDDAPDWDNYTDRTWFCTAPYWSFVLMLERASSGLPGRGLG